MTISTVASTLAPYKDVLVVENSSAAEPILKERDINAVDPAALEPEYLKSDPLKKEEPAKVAPHAKLEVEVANDGPQPRVVLHSTVPFGFAVVDNEVFEGKKIIATRRFEKGEFQ